MKKKVIVPKKYFTVTDAIFGRLIHVFINHTHNEFAEFARKKGATDYKNDDSADKNFAAFSTVMESNKGPDEFVICVKNFDWTIKDQGTLIHEIVHTIIKIWKANNIPYNDSTQEFLAHSIGNLYEDISGKIFNRTKFKK